MAIIDQSKVEEPEYFSSQVRTAKRFFRPDSVAGAADGFRVVSGGLEYCIAGYEVERRQFPYWAIEFLRSGTGSLRLGRKRYDIGPGSVFAYSPDLPHRIAADKDEPLEKYFVDLIAPTNEAGHFENTGLAGFAGRAIFSSSPTTIRRTFDEIIEFGNVATRRSGDICSRLVELLLLKIAETETAPTLATSAAYAAYRRSREMIDNRFLELASVHDIAAAANMDVSYLCRLFKRFDEQTPYQLLTRLRMNYAAGLLVREGMSVKQTAAELGYDDAFTFSRRFKNAMGQSPRVFTQGYRR